MSDTDIHSCGYYCDRPACLKAQRDELRERLYEKIYVKTYSGGKPNYTQPIEQEPIAYLCENAVGHKYFRWKKPPNTYKPIALYTEHVSPQRIWQGLTDEEIYAVENEYLVDYRIPVGCGLYFAKDIETKLKEKNNG